MRLAFNEGSSSTSAPQISPTVADTLKKILENQTTIMNTLVAHGAVIEEIGKQINKMKKSQASKKSVDRLRREVTRIATTGDLPFDMLMEIDPETPVDPAAPSALVAPVG
uniref:Uncharacterized protein LOC104233919 n=1 Tax=Nicotiana sylvestris TaxID=4096 RepID=A0A1U7XFG1_NICSY|nr:PREDICTED: uncharacterized protein LOC104233919 [Nicotiana sylvestris]XP_009785684.1 PREDICTED: uncharacterized protein LOC104233919 [Nicotiana sylvestris]